MADRKPVPYNDLRGYLKLLEDKGMLVRISAEVNLDGELGAIAYRDLVRDGPALWFDNIKDYPGMPLVANIMYREDQLALALNGEADWANLRDIIHDRPTICAQKQRLAIAHVFSVTAAPITQQ